MTEDTPPVGRLFSRVYLERSDALTDSARFRTRVWGYYAPHDHRVAHILSDAITRELGVQVPNFGNGPVFKQFFQKADIRDVLDTITLVRITLSSAVTLETADLWVANVQRALTQEGLAYTVDAKGGVHRAIDSEFDHNRASAIRALSGSRYAAVSEAFSNAFKKLEQPHQDLKGSVRDIFEAAETLAKLFAATNDNLDSAFVKKRLRPLVDGLYATDAPTVSTAGRMLSSFEGWVNAAHPFRHGHQTEVPITLPEDLAILLLSQGASFIRWLVDIDRRQQA